MAKLPEFKTEEEFIEFFETHDLADYWDEFEEVHDIEIAIPRPSDKSVAVRLYPDLLDEIKKVAKRKGVSYQVLVQQWLTERLNQEKTTT